MLQTEEVDDDYFTPTSSTTLANIFGSASASARSDDHVENTSLKYSPSKGQSAVSKSENALKSNECIFACALFAYEWFDNKYLSRGKLGFAIVKDLKSNVHDIVLYDSNKTTLSKTTVSSKLEITVKENVYMSFYDNYHKYWSICATEQELHNTSELLKSLSATLKYCHSMGNDMGPPGPHDTEPNQLGYTPTAKTDKESDTDSSLNKKTKNSILSRMASMGQSVLPRKTVSAEKASDSSDNDLDGCNSKAPRHKPVKCIVKRINTDKVVPDVSTKVITTQSTTFFNPAPLYAHSTGQIMLLDNNSGIHAGSGNELNLVLAEQRMSNSELRINVNRINDKMDQVLEKIKDFSQKEVNINSSHFHMDILQKLMTEYENKIKTYEDLLSSNNSKTDSPKVWPRSMETESNKFEELEVYKSKILELQNKVTEKNEIISTLDEEIKLLKKSSIVEAEVNVNNIKRLNTEIEQLKQVLYSKEQEIRDISKVSEREHVTLASGETSNSDMGNKLKLVMNDIFKTIAANFDGSNSYSGDTIKVIVANIIKKVTMESLKEKQ